MTQKIQMTSFLFVKGAEMGTPAQKSVTDKDSTVKERKGVCLANG